MEALADELDSFYFSRAHLGASTVAGSQPCDFPVDIPHMAELSMTMVRKALQALTERDAELATSVLAMDDAVDEMNRRAKAVLLDCIARDSSAARSAVNLLFISRSLERIADHATNMAEDVIFWVCGADVRHGNVMQARSVHSLQPGN